jgi:hypothetical protein
MKQILLVLCGAVAGGIVGYFGFFWILNQGYYALILPGGLLGFGAGIAKTRSILVAVSCGLAATALGLFTEWRSAPFINDGSLGYFIAHVHQLKPVTLVMILVGSLIAFWVPYRCLESSPAPGGTTKQNRQDEQD